MKFNEAKIKSMTDKEIEELAIQAEQSQLSEASLSILKNQNFSEEKVVKLLDSYEKGENA